MGGRDRSRGRDVGDAAEQGWRVSRMRSAGRTRFQLTPDSVRGERMRRYAPQGGAAVDAVPECFSGGASAAHLHRLLCPRRCRGLTESVTAHAVGQRRGGSSASAKRRRDAVGSAGRTLRSRGQTLPLLREAPSGCGRAAVYFVARGGLIRKMWSVARVNDVYSHR